MKYVMNNGMYFLYTVRNGIIEFAPYALGVGVIGNSMKVAKFAMKYPKLTETLIGGTVSTGADITNDEWSYEKMLGNYALSGVLAGKSRYEQFSINIGYQSFVSINDTNKSSEESGNEVMTKAIGTLVGFKTDNLLKKTPLGEINRNFTSSIFNSYFENKIYNEIKTKDEKTGENK